MHRYLCFDAKTTEFFYCRKDEKKYNATSDFCHFALGTSIALYLAHFIKLLITQYI